MHSLLISSLVRHLGLTLPACLSSFSARMSGKAPTDAVCMSSEAPTTLCTTQPIPLVRCLASHTACPTDADMHALSSGALAEALAIQRPASQRSSGARPMLQPSSGAQPCSSSARMLRWPARAQVHACSRPSHPQRSCSGACSSSSAIKTQDPPPKVSDSF
ncbi:hypothetical protein GUJ93_ZPchr0011g27311 [Zizania palustris]|uniref:Secreted protein n=1 Tax=Zizania palustris TaxID=103762 RepID=A0A8J6BPH0_ZIZPA|nr:hypothetical protein GUJ93_ZPchr0011g27311 [Zizania palustris]